MLLYTRYNFIPKIRPELFAGADFLPILLIQPLIGYPAFLILKVSRTLLNVYFFISLHYVF